MMKALFDNKIFAVTITVAAGLLAVMTFYNTLMEVKINKDEIKKRGL
jgi:2',3'-cyclic-nucleotide 2'-phosphodiesterase (5'-nucleotidase family)